mgnify:CR=1 FL=1|jgi:vacuolar protein sorting-associated protein 13A/C
MNLTSRVIDNIQVSISNIHFRFEELSLPQPLSLGLTMGRLEMRTADEAWQPGFIDRTLSANRDTPLQKLVNLRSMGVYCRPNDDKSLALSKMEPEQIHNLMSVIFGENDETSPMYREFYLSEPLSMQTKLKQQASTNIQDEPLYSVDCVIDAIHLALAKTQFEQLLRALEHISSYGIFVDSTLNHRAIQLRDFFKARKMTEE